MAASRNFSSVSGLMQLTAEMTGSSTLATVDSVGGLPAVPFTLLLDPGTTSEEIVTVTQVSGLTLTVTRGQDGSVAVAHTIGAEVRHGATARDFREALEHVGATTGVHGLAAGTAPISASSTNTLTNKTISGSSNTLQAIPGSALNDASVTQAKLSGTISADRIDGRTIFVQSAQPTANAVGDLWFKTA